MKNLILFTLVSLTLISLKSQASMELLLKDAGQIFVENVEGYDESSHYMRRPSKIKNMKLYSLLASSLVVNLAQPDSLNAGRTSLAPRVTEECDDVVVIQHMVTNERLCRVKISSFMSSGGLKNYEQDIIDVMAIEYVVVYHRVPTRQVQQAADWTSYLKTNKVTVRNMTQPKEQPAPVSQPQTRTLEQRGDYKPQVRTLEGRPGEQLILRPLVGR